MSKKVPTVNANLIRRGSCNIHNGELILTHWSVYFICRFNGDHQPLETTFIFGRLQSLALYITMFQNGDIRGDLSHLLLYRGSDRMILSQID